MDFDLTKDQQDIKKAAREFAEEIEKIIISRALL
jgi:hypothetical protein